MKYGCTCRNRRGNRPVSAFVVVLLTACCALAQDGPATRPPQPAPEVSTRPAAGRADESPLMLNIEKDRFDSRIGLDYSLRWDFSDLKLKRFRPDRLLTGGISALVKWDITDNTRIKYYGFSTNPWRVLVAKDRVGGSAGPGSPVAGGGARPQYRKRMRLSLSPLVDDVKRDLDENVRNLLLESSFNGVSDRWRSVPRREKKEFFHDVMSLDVWTVPGLDEAGKGLEYISK